MYNLQDIYLFKIPLLRDPVRPQQPRRSLNLNFWHLFLDALFIPLDRRMSTPTLTDKNDRILCAVGQCFPSKQVDGAENEDHNPRADDDTDTNCLSRSQSIRRRRIWNACFDTYTV